MLIAPWWSYVDSGSTAKAKTASSNSLQPVYESNIATWQCPSDPTITVRYNETYQQSSQGYRSARCSYAANVGIGLMEGMIVSASTLTSPTFNPITNKQRVRGVRPELRCPVR